MEEQEVTVKPRIYQKYPVTLASITAIIAICAVVLPMMTVVFRPFVVGILASAMTTSIDAQVAMKTAPISAGVKVLIRGQISKLQDEVDELEFTQTDPAARSAAGARKLATKKRELEEARTALRAIEDAERPTGPAS